MGMGCCHFLHLVCWDCHGWDLLFFPRIHLDFLYLYIYICSSLTECLCLYLHQGIRPPYCPSLPINKICQ
jgi:hypothetical protein